MRQRKVSRFQTVWILEVKSRRDKQWQATGGDWFAYKRDAMQELHDAQRGMPTLMYRVTKYIPADMPNRSVEFRRRVLGEKA